MMAISISRKLRSLLVPSTRIVVFTGAGASAESGVPTFRGDHGLWKSFSVQELASPQGFAANPRAVWQWYQWRRELIARLNPNLGHFAIAQMENSCDRFCLVTQNVDGLHDRAGSSHILKLHGDIWEIRCVSCGSSKVDREVKTGLSLPRCHCGSLLRPGVVWFGEVLPGSVLEEAFSESARSQLFLSVGTSAEVYPAALLPQIAAQRGAYVVEINIEASAMGHVAHEVLLGKSGDILPQLATLLNEAAKGRASGTGRAARALV